MAISLYDATVAGYLQTLGAVSGFLDRGAAHCAEAGTDPDALVGVRLHADMLPLAFQIWSVEHHSLGAIEGCQTGHFAPPRPMPELDYAGLRRIVAETRDKLATLTPADIESLEGRDVVFTIGERKLPFTAEGFLFSFSIPNFHFHATTAYDILRAQGVPLGKRYYLGHMRMKA
jgi:hypothetical protein